MHQLQSDDMTTPPRPSLWQRWPGRDRRERTVWFVLTLVGVCATSVMVRWTMLSGWPIWVTLLLVIAWGCVVLTCWCLWCRRYTPARTHEIPRDEPARVG